MFESKNAGMLPAVVVSGINWDKIKIIEFRYLPAQCAINHCQCDICASA